MANPQQNTLANAQAALRALKNCELYAQQSMQVQLAAIQPFGSTTDVGGQLEAAGQTVTAQQSAMVNALVSAALPVFGMFAPTISQDRTTVQQSLQTAMALMSEYMLANQIYLKYRGVAYGAAAAGGSNVGNATLYVHTVNRRAKIVESATIETLTFTCDGPASQQSQIGLETYTVKGGGAGDYPALQDVGPGITPASFQAYGPAQGGIITQNNSFDSSFSGTAADSAIPGWTVVSGGDKIEWTDDYYAQNRGGTPASLKITGNCKIQFNLRENGVSLDELQPYLAALWWAADASAGTVTIRLGPSTSGGFSTNVATSNTTPGAGSGFTKLALVSSASASAWPQVFDTTGNPVLEIEVSSYTSGNIYIDDVVGQPFQYIGGRWMAILSGTTASVYGDSFTQACTLTTNTAGQVELTGGGSGSVDTITVGGVSILPAAVSFTSTLAATAAAVVAAINAVTNRTAPAYIASNPSGAIIKITQVVPVEGTITVASTVTTITKTDTNMSGASFGQIADCLWRLCASLGFFAYLPADTSATSGWGDS